MVYSNLRIATRFCTINPEISVDVAIIGGGYAGLTAGLFLARAGADTALLEAQKVGFGASGRNGGQLGAGQRMDQRDLIKLVGENLGDKLWHLADDAIDTVKTIIKRDKIDCFLRPGVAILEIQVLRHPIFIRTQNFLKKDISKEM